MIKAAALALAVVGLIWIEAFGPAPASAQTGAALALGFTLLGASVAGDALRRVHLPRLTGYLLFGIASGPYLGNIITQPMALQLQALSGVATAFIAFIAGLSLNVRRLGPRIGGVVRLAATVIAIASVVVAGAVWATWRWLPIAPEATGLAQVSMVLLVTVMIVSFSPTMTAAVTTDTGARGPFSELVLAVVVIADLVALVMFSVAMQLARGATGVGPLDGLWLIQFIWEIGGALAFGVLAGALFALYLRYVGRQVTLVVAGLCILLSQVGTTQQFEPLLAALAAGLIVENLSTSQGDALKTAVQQAALPVLVVFFVGIGASLRLDALRDIGLAAIGLSALRFLLIRIGVAAGTRGLSASFDTAGDVWTGLISQAGITLGFAAIVARDFGDWGMNLQAVVVALIAIHELAGPFLFRRALLRANERQATAPRPLMVVSNREPYLHARDDDGTIRARAATGGVAVALDALMRERGGIWVAHGAGSGDGLVVDDDDKVMVPPGHPSYTLRRLWFDAPLFASYYSGFANEGLWPLCHQVDVRPQFRSEDWSAYREVNERFAAAVDRELGAADGPVFIQDYHLALVASMLRARRPTAKTALFWHIPWPSPDRLRICPWRREIVSGLLANNLVAFQLERDRRNFLLAAEDVGARFESDTSSVTIGDHETTVVAVPIGVDYDRIQEISASPSLPLEQGRLRAMLGLRAPIIGVGVDRLDYTKGIPERLAALDEIIRRQPSLRGRLTFVQIGVPSRSEVGSYAALEAEIDELVDALNRKHPAVNGVPLVRYHKSPLTIDSLVALYKLATFCVVSSLHDGMNLVAKEFVAAREDEDGALVLSSLAGAAQELGDALIINPYDIHGFADALLEAIDMPREERLARMRKMRRVVAGRNVFGWASDILEGLESLWTQPLHYSVRRWEDMAV